MGNNETVDVESSPASSLSNRLHFMHVSDYCLKHTYSTISEWDIPLMKREKSSTLPSPEDFIRFGFLPGGKALDGKTVHFFVDDWRFEKVWANPEVWTKRFVSAQGLTVLTPDFSLYRDWPRSAQLWNTFRSRWCGRLWQEKALEAGSDLRVIPTVSWGDKGSYDFCFDGLQPRSTLAIASLGICRVARTRPVVRDLFSGGVLEMDERLDPHAILCYGTEWPFALQDWPETLRNKIVYYPQWRDIKGRGQKPLEVKSDLDSDDEGDNEI